MIAALARGALLREGQIVLRRLERAGVRLVRRERGWLVEGCGSKRGRPAKPLDPRLVEGLVAEGLIARTEEGACDITPAGRIWLVDARPHGGTRRDGGGMPSLNPAESPLAWLRSRKGRTGTEFSEEEFDAGERLRRDFTVSRLESRLTASWDAAVNPSHGRMAPPPESSLLSERALAAKQRYFRALDAVGPELASVLIEVCCLASGLEAAERRLGWPQRTGKVVLKLALAALARHYGLTKPASPASAPRLRHWGAEGFRPQIGRIG